MENIQNYEEQKTDLSILIVDDDMPSRVYSEILLKQVSNTVFTAEDGAQGLQIYNEFQPDIVITDIAMPYLNGIDMSRKIKSINPKAQIILTSAFNDTQFLIQSIEIGVNYYLLKPIQKKQLIDTVMRVIEYRNLEKEIEEQTLHIKKLSQAVEQSPSMLLILDKNRNIEYANPKYVEISGFSFDEIRKSTLTENSIEILFPDSVNKLVADRIKIERKQEIRKVKKNGDEYWVSAALSTICDESNDIVNYIVTFEDITEFKNAQYILKGINYELEKRVQERTAQLQNTNELLIAEIAEREKAEQEMRQAKEIAEAANKAKDSFLAKVSHELRTPMNSILGILKVLLDSELNKKQQKFLNIVKSSAENLLNIINDILDITKIEAGKIELKYQTFNLISVVQQVIELHIYSAKKKNIELKSIFLKPLPENVIGDPFRLQQVLNNLIGNAIKFTDRGEVTVAVKQIAENKRKSEIQFSISDTGIGIAENKMDLLFKSFSQVENSETRESIGTGLGLAISKELIDMMNGKIWVESKLNIGSTFHFTVDFNLPVNKIKYDKSIEEFIDLPSRQLKILVVEDNLINLEVVKQVLLSKKWEFVFASNGKEALEVSRTNSFDVILIDIQLPDMSGIELIKLIKENTQNLNQKSPAIAITGHGSLEYKKMCLDAGFDSFITKPYNWDNLLKEICRLTKNFKNKTNSVINLERLLITINENKAVLSNIINYYKNNYTEEIKRIKQAFAANDYDKINHIVHHLKSEVENFDALRAVDIAQKIEQKCFENDKKEIEELIPILENELIKIAAELPDIKID